MSRHLVLKKKESRMAWQWLMQGIVVADRRIKKAPKADRDAYAALREKVLAAWKKGVALKGIRPKSDIHAIAPEGLFVVASSPAADQRETAGREASRAPSLANAGA